MILGCCCLRLQIVGFCYLKWINNSFRNPELKKADVECRWGSTCLIFDASSILWWFKANTFWHYHNTDLLAAFFSISKHFFCVCGSGNAATICQYGATTNKFVSLVFYNLFKCTCLLSRAGYMILYWLPSCRVLFSLKKWCQRVASRKSTLIVRTMSVSRLPSIQLPQEANISSVAFCFHWMDQNYFNFVSTYFWRIELNRCDCGKKTFCWLLAANTSEISVQFNCQLKRSLSAVKS